MSKLKVQNGDIVIASNGMRAVSLDDEGNLTVILPEGVRMLVIPADSGLRTKVDLQPGDALLWVDTVRVSPRPEIDPGTYSSTVDPRPLCVSCGGPWVPAEGVGATVELCPHALGAAHGREERKEMMTLESQDERKLWSLVYANAIAKWGCVEAEKGADAAVEAFRKRLQPEPGYRDLVKIHPELASPCPSPASHPAATA